VISTKKTAQVIHLSCGLPVMGTREWWEHCSGGATSTPTNQMSTGKHHSVVLLGMGTRE